MSWRAEPIYLGPRRSDGAGKVPYILVGGAFHNAR